MKLYAAAGTLRQEDTIAFAKELIFTFFCHKPDKLIEMKKIFLLIFISNLFLLACDKNGQPAITESTGVIISMSGEKCMCCWGWNITIDGSIYRFEEIPASSSLHLNTITFPTVVNIKWRNAEGQCKETIIEVQQISRR